MYRRYIMGNIVRTLLGAIIFVAYVAVWYAVVFLFGMTLIHAVGYIIRRAFKIEGLSFKEYTQETLAFYGIGSASWNERRDAIRKKMLGQLVECIKRREAKVALLQNEQARDAKGRFVKRAAITGD